MMDEDAVRKLWDTVPPVQCRGLCVESCGPVPMTAAEARIIGKPTTFNADTLTCSHLNPFGACSIYKDRPLVCRLWGATPAMQCPFGCKPTMTAHAAQTLTVRMIRAGGDLVFPESVAPTSDPQSDSPGTP